MKRRLLLVALMLLPVAARASGAANTIPWALDPYGGPPAEQARFYAGHPGILLARAPWARLFAAWRMLHGMAVAPAAADSLMRPCCSAVFGDDDSAAKVWTAARAKVPGVPKVDPDSILLYTTVGDFGWVQTCFPDAFLTAARTLTDRIARHGAADPWVRLWVQSQDAVFTRCNADAPMPPLPADAPAWLRADRAYQQAAYALYARDFAAAEADFQAIAADVASPWARYAPYLAARAAVTAALPTHDAAAFAHARGLLAALDPPTVFGHDQQARLAGALDFRDRPDQRRQAAIAALTAPVLTDTAGADLKDLRRLGPPDPAPNSPDPGSRGQPEFLDWLATFGRIPDNPQAVWPDHYRTEMPWKTDADALAHARARWAATADPAWLLAAMVWSNPGPEAADLVAAARTLPPDSPAWLTALYQRIRLAGPSPADQADLDAALARKDLSLTDRNLLLAERVLALRDAGDLLRLGPRRSPCLTIDDTPKGCLNDLFGLEELPYSFQRPDVNLGDETALLLDRLPLALRARLALSPGLPAPLAFDLAFTTWVRAVLLEEDATAAALIPRLKAGLPQLAAAWDSYRAAPPGPDRRFAAWFILAQVPGADTDLAGGNYTRPVGRVADFQGHWRDWLYAPAGAPPRAFPAPPNDPVCDGLCGAGAFPLTVPAAIADLAPQALRERGRYRPAPPASATPAAGPPLGSVWEDVLAYAKAHPADPRVPEALYWLVRVSHFGSGHNRSSYRAYRLLHERYGNTHWAKASRYFYD